MLLQTCCLSASGNNGPPALPSKHPSPSPQPWHLLGPPDSSPPHSQTPSEHSRTLHPGCTAPRPLLPTSSLAPCDKGPLHSDAHSPCCSHSTHPLPLLLQQQHPE